ncbi:glutathione S-transferase family protein [Spongiibacter sp.]|uniref:glutathione S-transferase family protein n=1 Tax=Spongiibacter sp. TaxID=2024860 RepID=UPI000C3D1D74|nr:glutathione S-transferase family protein [Spongiibacter sp.]MBU72367.1 glutathione S-transferase [Spongiibacter sp.]
MTDTRFTITTFDWVPEFPRGFVRDLRARWALEEAGLDYTVESVPFHNRQPAHFSQQAFGQVPWLREGDITLFESGAMLLHIGEQSDTLLPTAPAERAEVIQWLFAALNSVEMASLPWFILRFTDGEESAPERARILDFLKARLRHMEAVLADREWLADSFSIADIAMADVLRLVDRLDGLDESPHCRRYVEQASSRPAFKKAHADQLAHFAQND